MAWNFSFQLLPDEIVVEDSTKRRSSGLKPVYSVFLTNKRAIFRFDGLGSSLTQSFFYHEVLDVMSCRRLFVSYLAVKTSKKDCLLNTGDADYWSKRILEMKSSRPGTAGPKVYVVPPLSERTRGELSDMLKVLRKHSLLSEEELEEKLRLLEAMRL